MQQCGVACAPVEGAYLRAGTAASARHGRRYLRFAYARREDELRAAGERLALLAHYEDAWSHQEAAEFCRRN